MRTQYARTEIRPCIDGAPNRFDTYLILGDSEVEGSETQTCLGFKQSKFAAGVSASTALQVALRLGRTIHP